MAEETRTSHHYESRVAEGMYDRSIDYPAPFYRNDFDLEEDDDPFAPAVYVRRSDGRRFEVEVETTVRELGPRVREGNGI